MGTSNIFPEAINFQLRRQCLGQRGHVFWFFGRSGSGKSTITRTCDELLLKQGWKTIWLDGDSFRRGVSRDLGFSEKDRAENLRRAAESAKLLVENELLVFCSFITPLNSQRAMIKTILAEKVDFILIDSSLKVCQERDPKRLYSQHSSGPISKRPEILDVFEDPSVECLKLSNNDGEMKLGQHTNQFLELLQRRELRQI